MIHKPLWIFKPSIFFFLITYLFLYFRGFGWDGDTLISGTQFIKLLNPALRGLQDGGTQPKILMMVLVGILSQVDHNFILLTFLCIILNSVMVGVLCNWTKKEGGNWWIVLLAICLNLNYLLLIINCDNPAFSIPFIFFGLYFYFNLKEKLKGILFLVISSFFRPGAELIIIILFLKELYYKNNKYIIQNLLAISVCFIHSYYGWFLSYPNKEVYLMTTYRNPHGKMLAVPLYLKTLYKQLQYPNISLFFGLALFGINNLLKSKRQIVNIILGVVPTIILPIATFIYGVTNHIGVEKIMEFSIVYAVLAGFAFKKILIKKSLFLIPILFAGYMGRRWHGVYQCHPNGSGLIPFKRIKYKTGYLPTDGERTMYILDYGLKIKSTDLIIH